MQDRTAMAVRIVNKMNNDEPLDEYDKWHIELICRNEVLRAFKAKLDRRDSLEREKRAGEEGRTEGG